jgi:hypothetical protein
MSSESVFIFIAAVALALMVPVILGLIVYLTRMVRRSGQEPEVKQIPRA